MKKEYKGYYTGILYYNNQQLPMKKFAQICIKKYREKKGKSELVLTHKDDWEEGFLFHRLIMKDHVLVGKKHIMPELNLTWGKT